MRSSWPVVSAATHANLDNLPLIDHEVVVMTHVHLRMGISYAMLCVFVTCFTHLSFYFDLNTCIISPSCPSSQFSCYFPLSFLCTQVASNQSEELQRRTTGGRVLHFELSQPGPLGLHLDINTKRGIVRFSAPVEGGQAATRVAEVETQLALSGRKLKGAYLTKVRCTCSFSNLVTNARFLVPFVLMICIYLMLSTHQKYAYSSDS